MDGRDGRDGCPNRSHSFVELIFGLVCANDGPCGSVIDHFFVGLLGTWCRLFNQHVTKNNPDRKIVERRKTHLELDDSLLREAEIHPLCVLHVEGALVELGDGIVRVQDSHLFVHLPDDEPRQGHASHAAHQLDGTAVVDVTVSDGELFRFRLAVVHWKVLCNKT